MSAIRKPIHIPGRRLALTKNMIANAQENTKSAAEAARWLEVSYNTYKKWAKFYGVFEQHLNQEGKGVKKGWASYKIPLEEIFKGKKTNYSLSTLKKRMIEEGYWPEECHICDWNEERLTDNRICLSIDFIDGNTENKEIKNIRLLCPNCYLSNNGHFNNSKLFCK